MKRLPYQIFCQIMLLMLVLSVGATEFKRFHGIHEWVSSSDLVVVQLVKSESRSREHRLCRFSLPGRDRLRKSVLYPTPAAFNRIPRMKLSPDRRTLCILLTGDPPTSGDEIRFMDVGRPEAYIRSKPFTGEGRTMSFCWSPDGGGAYMVWKTLGRRGDTALLYVDSVSGEWTEVFREDDIDLVGFVGNKESLWYSSWVDGVYTVFSYNTRTHEKRFCFADQPWGAVWAYPFPYTSIFLDEKDYTVHNVSLGISWSTKEETDSEFSIGSGYYDEPNGRVFFCVDRYGPDEVRVFDMRDGHRLGGIILSATTGPMRNIRVSPDGRLCSMAGEETLMIYDLETWAKVDSIPLIANGD